MAKRAAEGDISDRPLKQARTAEQLRQAIGEYIIAIPPEVLALVGLSVVDLATVADVSQDWRRAVFTLLLSTQHGKEMRLKMGLSEKDVVEAIDNDTFIYELRTLARFHRDFTNPLSGKPVAMVDTVLNYLHDGLITGADRYEQAYDLILRLTRVATMLAVKQLFQSLYASTDDDYRLGLTFSGIRDHADGKTYAITPEWIHFTHPVLACLGLNAHSIHIAAERTPAPIELQFYVDHGGVPYYIQFGPFGLLSALFNVEEQDITLTRMPSNDDDDVSGELPLAQLRVHNMRNTDGTRCSFGLSVRHINVDAMLSLTAMSDGGRRFDAYAGFARPERKDDGGRSPTSLTTMRRLMLGLPPHLIAAYDFITLGLNHINSYRVVALVLTVDTPPTSTIAHTYFYSYLALAKEIDDAYLREEDITMLFDAYHMWQYMTISTLYDRPFDLRRRWLPDEFPAPRRRPDGTLHRTFWRSPLIQCATCPAEVVTHVSVKGESHEGRCATCATQQ